MTAVDDAIHMIPLAAEANNDTGTKSHHTEQVSVDYGFQSSLVPLLKPVHIGKQADFDLHSFGSNFCPTISCSRL